MNDRRLLSISMKYEPTFWGLALGLSASRFNPKIVLVIGPFHLAFGRFA